MLKKLYLRHFRNYTEAEVVFSKGVNWIIGKNAQGKTNLLEAIYLLCTGRSFRTHQLSQLIQRGALFFYLEAEIEKDGMNQNIKISYDGLLKKAEHNGNVYSHFTPLIGIIPHILYAPEDISLITGAPSFRRRFLDLQLAQVDPLYIHHLTRYYRAMRHRNELLKKRSEEAIDAWEEIMGRSAKYLIQKRTKLIEQLQSPLLKNIQTLSANTDSIKIQYQSTFFQKDENEILNQWQKNRKKELHVGTTLYGPHRDEVLFSMQELSAKSFASEGQKHSFIAALRLCQWKHLYLQTNQIPLLSVDDFGVHLDKQRQNIFQDQLKNLGQIFLTSPHEMKSVFSDNQTFLVDSGKVS